MTTSDKRQFRWPSASHILEISPSERPGDDLPGSLIVGPCPDTEPLDGQTSFPALFLKETIMEPFDDKPTWLLPVIEAPARENKASAALGVCLPLVHSLVRSSGIYAFASMALPLIALVLQPLLTHRLSASDYGILTILNTLAGLLAGISQLGLGSAFFRAYSYDYSSPEDRRKVLATVTTLLLLSSLPLALGMVLLAPWLNRLLLGSAAPPSALVLTGLVVLLQNLTVSGYAWLRAEGRARTYVLLTIIGALVTLVATLLLVLVWRLGVAGALLGTCCGYGAIVLCLAPTLLVRTGLSLRRDITRNVLAFGLPLVLNFVSYWVLQLSDRYLLAIFSSFEQTARYGVAYSLGSILLIVVIGPFTRAWPSVMFAIARQEQAAQSFRLIFRGFGLLLLFAAAALSLAGLFLLETLFPGGYAAAAPIIPLVAGALVFYGIYYLFMIGPNIARKTWLAAVFTSGAGLLNLGLNLFLIPRYGALGAGLSTLIAYAALAALAYVVNQRLYPIPFELGRFSGAFLLGVALYAGCELRASGQPPLLAWGLRASMLALYGLCLLLIGRWPARSGSGTREVRPSMGAKW